MKTLTKKVIFLGFISVLLFGSILCSISIPTQTKGSSKNITLSSNDFSFNKIKLSSVPYSNITVVSDGYKSQWNWNDDRSERVSITNDDFGNIHAVWSDRTNTKWGTDTEIMYAKWTTTTGWSNASVISDGYKDHYWNNRDSNFPSIAADHFGNLHVVWHDATPNSEKWGGGDTDYEIMYVNWTAATGWSNATVISDGYNNEWGWNNGQSQYPKIAVDDFGNIHVVWNDDTDTKWGSDWEIMYANYLITAGKWSNASVISDGYQEKYWNTGSSWYPSIAVDGSGKVHVVWQDFTPNQAKWGSDWEIMYVNWMAATGWSNASVISDGYKNIWKRNGGASQYPSIAVDGSDNIYVVWSDDTSNLAKWGTDVEIMYANWTAAMGWSNFSVISDGYEGKWKWNDGFSQNPSIAVDSSGNIHVAWYDDTNNTATWGIDTEIMYTKRTVATGWSNASVISDGYNNVWGWNNGTSAYPSIAVDGSGNIHVAWHDTTSNTATWGTDWEIMHVIIPIIISQLPVGGGDDDDGNGDNKEGGIIYGYDIVLLIATIFSVSAIYLKKINLKKYKK